MKKKNYLTLLMAILLAFVFTGCADVETVEACMDDSPYGFFGGLWHGMIVFFSFIGSLFSDDIAVYAVNNTGGWYDFGFMLGAGLLFGGGTKAAS